MNGAAVTSERCKPLDYRNRGPERSANQSDKDDSEQSAPDEALAASTATPALALLLETRRPLIHAAPSQ
jgi:hypothetical protein